MTLSIKCCKITPIVLLASLESSTQEGLFIITFVGGPVATASTVDPAPGAERLELGWVSVSPDHQAKGLGYQVCLAVMHYTYDLGYTETVLSTDDWRLPAIGLYLSLGFEPRMTAADMPNRWEAIMQKLSENR